jgi:hypothetical protein
MSEKPEKGGAGHAFCPRSITIGYLHYFMMWMW